MPNGTRIRERQAGTLSGKQSGFNRDGYVLFLGRFSPEKNCDLLIDAFEKIDTAMKLVLAGGSSHTDDYVHRLHQHQSEKIKILDWISGDALEEVLTNAALFILPSDLEGLSLALLDAMGAGVCVLASDVPENVEALGDAGFTFRRRDVNDLQRMLALLLADSASREDVARRAQARIRARIFMGRSRCRNECGVLVAIRAVTGRSVSGNESCGQSRPAHRGTLLTPKLTGSIFAVKCRRKGAS